MTEGREAGRKVRGGGGRKGDTKDSDTGWEMG